MASASTACGLTARTASGVRTAQRDVHVAANTCLSTTRRSGPTSTAATSTIVPAPVSTPSRAATSLFSNEELTSTARVAGPTRPASASATTGVSRGCTAPVSSTCTTGAP